jgi:hypothetical protein
MIGLVQRSISSTVALSSDGSACTLAISAGCSDQGEQATGGRVARGLVAGRNEDLVEGEHVDQRQRLAVDRGVREQRDQIILRILHPFVAQLSEVRKELDVGAHHRLGDGLAIAAVLGIARAGALVRPGEEQLPVFGRDAQHVRDHGDRQRCRHGLHEIAALGLTRLEILEGANRNRLDLIVQLGDLARRHALADQLAVL